MNVHAVPLGSGSAHWHDAGGHGPLLHFYHANGFPSGCITGKPAAERVRVRIRRLLRAGLAALPIFAYNKAMFHDP